MLSLQRWIIAAGCLTAATFAARNALAYDEPQSFISVLVDLSGTWHNVRSDPLNATVMHTIIDGVIEAANRLRTPTYIRVLPIGDLSLMRESLCQAIYDPQLVARPTNKGLVFQTPKSISNYLSDQCIKFVLTRPTEKYTDISGAIDTASRLFQGQPGTQKFIIVLSDMNEELRKTQSTIKLDLPDVKVFVLYRVLEEDRVHPERLDNRLSAWNVRLKDAGAKVRVLPDASLTPPQLVQMLIE